MPSSLPQGALVAAKQGQGREDQTETPSFSCGAGSRCQMGSRQHARGEQPPSLQCAFHQAPPSPLKPADALCFPQLSHFMVHYFQHSAFPSAHSNRDGTSKHHMRLARATHTLSPSGPSPACCPRRCPALLVPDRSMDAHSGCRNLLQNLNIPHSPPSPYLLWQLYPRTTPANYLSMTSLA